VAALAWLEVQRVVALKRVVIVCDDDEEAKRRTR
jgi:hypothetical protein